MTFRSAGRPAVLAWALGLAGCGLVRSTDVVVGEDYPKAGAGSGSPSPGGSDAGDGAPDGDGRGGAAGRLPGGGFSGSPATAGTSGEGGHAGRSLPNGSGAEEPSTAGAGGNGAGGTAAGSGDGGVPAVSACVELGLASEESAAVGLPGDFDHDGNLDLATANNDGTVSVFLGDGEGCWLSKATYATELGPDETWWDFPPVLAAADLDGNGTTDFVTTNPDAKAASVLLGSRDGSFALTNTYAIGASIIGLALVDWDADGIQDVVLATYASGGGATGGDAAVVLLRGRGDGSFGSAVPLWSEAISGGLNVTDLNHDGRPDVMLGGTTVLLHQPDDTIVHIVAGSFSADGASVSLGDLDGDRNVDVVVIEQCPSKGGPQYCHARLGLGDGTFEETWVQECECSRHEMIALASVTSDDTVDLIMSPTLVQPGAGDGTFLPERVASTSRDYPQLLALADWNHDGLLDIAVVSGDWVKVRLGSGDGRFGTLQLSSP